jgi:hypothetical protein
MKRAALAAMASLLTLAGFGYPPAAVAGGTRWQPPAGISFQWQLQGHVDTSVAADVFDVDLFDSPRSLVDELHGQGRHVVCYMSAGSYEKWRPDAGRFPRRVLGKPLEGWPGERWLDVRKLAALKPIMNARLDRCARKRFDGVEFDNIDVYSNDSGFPVTKAQNLDYVSYLSRAAHRRGLAAGLKNLPQLAKRLEPAWDFAVNEQCFQYHECGGYSAFIGHDKPVFQVEYELARRQFCPQARKFGFTSMRKRYSLRAWRRTC